MKWFIKCFKHYADFKGRARRKEFWFFMLFYFISIMLSLTVSYVILFSSNSTEELETMFKSFEMGDVSSVMGVWLIPYAVVLLATFLPSIAVQVRRLHDVGRSGWWVLVYVILQFLTVPFAETKGVGVILTLLSFAMGIVLLVWLFTDSQYEENQWGPCPKEDEPEEVLE